MYALSSAPTLRGWTIALLGIAALALLLWSWSGTNAPGTPLPERSGGPTNLAPTSAELAAQDAHRDDATTGSNDRRLPDRRATTSGDLQDGEWTVQLTGIDPSVPWTAPLLFVFEERAEARGTVDAGGACRFTPPAIARLPGLTNFRIVASDDHYRLANAHQLTDELKLTGCMEFAVHPIALLRGRVLGPDGKGMVARVRAFACDADGPREPLLARTDSSADGSYQLRVPPATPLLLLAEAVAAPAGLSSWLPAEAPLRYESGESTAIDDLRMDDTRRVRSEFLSATLRAEGLRSAPRTVPDLRLGAVALLKGRATFSDGRPLANALVIAEPEWAAAPAWQDHQHWSPTAGLVSGAQATTDERGAFVLPLLPGTRFRVRVASEDLLLVAGEPAAIASAPGYVDLVAPGDIVTLQVMADGHPVPRAWLDCDDLPRRVDGSGRLRVTLGPSAVRVRARSDLRASAWVDLPVGARPAVVTLDLVAADLAEVRLQLRSRPEVLAATFLWQPRPNGSPLSMTSKRERADEPFVLRVPAGSYGLLVGDCEELAFGEYLLPRQLEVEVPPAGLAVAHEVAFGGLLSVDLFDENGMRLGGTFTLRDAGGGDVTPSTVTFEHGVLRASAVGVLLPYHNRLAAALPPGDYALAVATPRNGRAQQAVTIFSRVTTAVSLRPR